MRKDLVSILLLLSLSLSSSSAQEGLYPKKFRGTINGEDVSLGQYRFSGRILKVKKSNGVSLIYLDKQGDNNVDFASVSKGKESLEYSGRDEIEKKILESASEAYVIYLNKISKELDQ